MTRLPMAGLLVLTFALTPGVEAALPGAVLSSDARATIRFVDLDFRGSRGQVQEYDGRYYKGAHGDLSVGNQGSAGLFDFSVKDIGSNEEEASLRADHRSGFRVAADFQNMNHRINYIRVGEIHGSGWIPKQAIDLVGVTETQELVMRRSEAALEGSFVSPENSARFVSVRYREVRKAGDMTWSYTGNPNIQRTAVDVDNSQRDWTIGLGRETGESGALNVDFLRSEYKDFTPTLPSRVDGGTGSSNNGGVIKRTNARQRMAGGELKFRQSFGQDLAVTGAFSGKRRDNLDTQYRDDIVVGALNAAYRVSKDLSLLGKFYLRANQIDENLGYTPVLNRPSDARTGVNTHQMDKTLVRGEFIVNYRPIERVKVKAAYKIILTNRRDAATQVYSGGRYYADGYFVPAPWLNETARNDKQHHMSVGATVKLPFDAELEAAYKKMRANRPAFVNLPNHQDDATAGLTVPLPLNLGLNLEGGYLQEKNTITQWTHYSQTRNTYRAGLDWSGNNSMFFGADVSYEAIRNFSELYFGSASATPSSTTAYHASPMNRQLNTVFGAHGRVQLPKGVAVSANGSYTRSEVTTPIRYGYVGGTVYDFTPGDAEIARGRVEVEYTPESYKFLTARASYAVSDWVDKFDRNNSGRASVVRAGVDAKF